MIALSAGRIFDGQALRPGGVVLIDDGRILDIVEVPPPGVATHTLPDGAILAPGYIDLQVNGGGGVLFNDAITPEALRIIATAHARCGTTAMRRCRRRWARWRRALGGAWPGCIWKAHF